MKTEAERKLYSVCNLVAMSTHSATGQKRKGSNKPYYIHPFSVSETLKENDYPITVVCAGLLHDVVEDTEISLEDLRFMLFTFDSIDGNYTQLVDETLKLVDWVTDRYTTKAIQANRKDRTMLEATKLLNSANPDAWAVKLADILDNLKDVEGIEVTFLKIWLTEKDIFTQFLPKGRYYAHLHKLVTDRITELDKIYHFRDTQCWHRYRDAMEFFLDDNNRKEFENAYRINPESC